MWRRISFRVILVLIVSESLASEINHTAPHCRMRPPPSSPGLDIKYLNRAEIQGINMVARYHFFCLLYLAGAGMKPHRSTQRHDNIPSPHATLPP
jgi:hypothetical protein